MPGIFLSYGIGVPVSEKILALVELKIWVGEGRRLNHIQMSKYVTGNGGVRDGVK